MKATLVRITVFALLATGLVGCGDKSTVTKETTVTTPGGTTTVRTEQEVKRTGDHPPPAQP